MERRDACGCKDHRLSWVDLATCVPPMTYFWPKGARSARIWAALLLMLSIGGIACRKGAPGYETMVGGHPLSFWLDRADAKTPLKIGGTNVLRALEAVLRDDETDRQGRTRFHLIEGRAEAPERWKEAILLALSEVGCEGASLAPATFDGLIKYGYQRNPKLFVLCHNYLLTVRCDSIMRLLMSELSRPELDRRSMAAFYLVGYGAGASNAVPELRVGLARGEPGPPLALASISPELPDLPDLLVRGAGNTNYQFDVRFQCLLGLSGLGPTAIPVAGRIADLLNLSIRDELLPRHLRAEYGNEAWRQAVLGVFARMGRVEGVNLALINNCLASSNPCTRVLAATAIWRTTRDPTLVIPTLIGLLGKAGLTPAFEYEFGQGPPNPLKRLTWTQRTAGFYNTVSLSCWSAAADILAEMGPLAESGLTALTQVVESDDHSVEQLFTRRAIVRIAGNSGDFLSMLVKCLDPDHPNFEWTAVIASIYFLGEMGESAVSALPLLEKLRLDEGVLIRAAAEAAIENIRSGKSMTEKR